MGYTFDDIQAKAWMYIVKWNLCREFLWERVELPSHDSDGVKTPGFSLCALLVWITGRNVLKFQNAWHDLQVIFLLLVTLVRLCVLVFCSLSNGVTSAPGLQEDKRGRERQLLPAWWRMGYFETSIVYLQETKSGFRFFFFSFWIGYYCKHRKLFMWRLYILLYELYFIIRPVKEETRENHC